MLVMIFLQVPLIVPAVVVVVSAYLVVAPLVINPDPFVIYATCFVLAGLFFYFPLLYFHRTVPGMNKITCFLQLFLNVTPQSGKLQKLEQKPTESNVGRYKYVESQFGDIDSNKNYSTAF